MERNEILHSVYCNNYSAFRHSLHLITAAICKKVLKIGTVDKGAIIMQLMHYIFKPGAPTRSDYANSCASNYNMYSTLWPIIVMVLSENIH